MTIGADKKAVVVALVDECLGTLRESPDSGTVRASVRECALRAASFQGHSDERRFLARTLCRLAHGLRAEGWVDAALDTLNIAVAVGAVDDYIVCEMAECHLAQGRVAEAEQILLDARRKQMKCGATYALLIAAHSRAGRLSDAVRLFDLAESDGANDAFTYSAMISAYTRARDMAGASVTFARAESTGKISDATFSAFARAKATVGDAVGLRTVLEAASQRGYASSRLTLIAIRALLEWNRFHEARRVFRAQLQAGHIDARCYTTFIAACRRMKYFREARWVAKQALRDHNIVQERWRIDAVHRALGSRERKPDGRL